jgi:Skp family chaperone for outer membrane proteins
MPKTFTITPALLAVSALMAAPAMAQVRSTVRSQIPAPRGVQTAAAAPAPSPTGGSPAAAPSGPSALTGPLVPGVCLISQTAVLQTSKAGVAAAARMKQLSDQAQAEVNAESAVLQSDFRALDAIKKIKPADKAARSQVLNQRLQALQQKAALRTREIETTRQKATARIAAEVPAIVPAIYKAHGCGLLFEKASVLAGNMGGDLTPEVIAALDAKMPTLTFDKEVLTPPAPGTAAPPPGPEAAATPAPLAGQLY